MAKLHCVGEDERRQIERSLVAGLSGDPAVVFAYLYGSFLESRPFHDIDVGVYVQGLEMERTSSIALTLAQRLSEQARKPVDVRILNVGPVTFLYHVLRGRAIFCRDETLLAEIMERTVARYLDIAPLLRRGTMEAFSA